VDSPDIKSPFSFFNYIVFNSAALQPEELESIINHEKVHSRQWHSLDMIIGQLFCIAFWFNPFAWLYKKSISQNLEFIADAEATKQLADKKSYQKTLLKITVQPECIAITNHFYQSLIKKRIVMLNKQQSKKRNSWKYAAVLPALAAFMFLFQVKVVAQVKDNGIKITGEKIKMSLHVNKDSKDAELNEQKDIFKKEFNAEVNFQNITRNQKEEITGIKVTVKDSGQSQVYEVAGNDPIRPFTIEVEKNGSGRNAINFGTGGKDFFMKADNISIVDGDVIVNEADSLNPQHHRLIRIPQNGNVPPAMAPPAPPVGHWSVNSMKIGSDEMLVVIDGVQQKKNNVIKLPLDREIDQVSVLKDKEGKKKYGKEGKKGVVEITTKRSLGLGSARAMNVVPGSFAFNIPDMEGIDFDFDFKGMPEDFAQIFGKEGDMQILGDVLSPEEMQELQDNLSSTQEELQRKFSKLDYNKMYEGVWNNIQESTSEELKQEIEDAKKEIREAKKEIEQARKEIEQSRKELNKKT